MENYLNERVNAVERCFTVKTYRVILSDPTFTNTEFQRVVITSFNGKYQIEQFTKTQAFHKNLDFSGAKEYILTALGNSFKQYNGWDEGESALESSIRISKKNRVLCRSAHTTDENMPARREAHNRKKSYILAEGSCFEPLRDMGIYTKDGKLVRSMEDKFRQINRFIEVVDHSMDAFESKECLNVLDFGCGKSYLTFILYYYLTAIKNKKVKMIGVDLKEDVIEHCNQSALKYGYDGLTFNTGDVKTFEVNDSIDIMVTLHACDTATDYALYNAVKWGAGLILSVPCCQHEVNSHMHSENLKLLERYGIIKERTSALITDAIRAGLLTAVGYPAQILEFIELEHTPKNLLIRAVRSGRMDAQALKEVYAICNEWSLNNSPPTLVTLFREDGII